MHKVINVLPLVVIVGLLTACALPGADPFAALSAKMPQNATSAPTSDATSEATKQPTPPPLSTIESCTVNAAQSLNLRSAPGTYAPVIGVLLYGEVVTINTRGAWLNVTTSAGAAGYINSNYCTQGK